MGSVFRTLEDFLASRPLHADGQLDDGWEALFPVKGREIEATILFADISSFSRRTADLTPVETLAFVNNFFAWISAEALHSGKGIIDKYIGDELMVVFSKEFGSDDPFLEAVQTARWMAENDALAFCPHIGIASGPVIVGYVGTPLRYNCSAFGRPVVLAARCAAAPIPKTDGRISALVDFPAEEWGDRVLGDVAAPEPFPKWELLGPEDVEVKGMPLRVNRLIKTSLNLPNQTAEERAREGVAWMKEVGLYRPGLPL